MKNLSNFAYTHDLSLPEWGPYSKRYIGISHLTSKEEGLRFDLSVFPGLYRRATRLPNVRTESGYHPWAAASDLSCYTHRHELLWKDQLYSDITFTGLNENSSLIEIKCVNNSDAAENMVLHFMANLNLPPLGKYRHDIATPARVKLPEGALLFSPLAYKSLNYEENNPKRRLQTDGIIRGSIRGNDFYNSEALGNFGAVETDLATYDLSIPKAINNATIAIRASSAKGERINLRISGDFSAQLELPGTGEAQLYTFNIGEIPAGISTLNLSSSTGKALDVDAIVVLEQKQLPELEFYTKKWNSTPDIIRQSKNEIILKFEHSDKYYAIVWPEISSEIRFFYTDTLDEMLRETLHDHVSHTFGSPQESANCYLNIFMRPVVINAKETLTFHALTCCGTLSDIEEELNNFLEKSKNNKLQQIIESGKSKALNFYDSLPTGDKYRFSQQLMAATTAMNIVFPIRTRGEWIRHSTPGRWWDSLYTWDSGMIGVGLLELDLDRAIENLNAYLSLDDDAAFIHHGSPLPTQFYIFHGLWNKTRSRELLEYFYPRLKRYYDFMAGHDQYSTTGKFKSGLLQTWDYFYNSGGWDDYPPQKYMHDKEIAHKTAPVVITAHVIRAAKIMRQAARELGLDLTNYDNDIKHFTSALQDHSWDDKDEYFSYVLHDEENHAQEKLRHDSGQNFNMGLGGASPLVSDICTQAQQNTLISKLFTTGRLWCLYGLSTVDQKATYYQHDGYWNGAIWMPHQWFFWKSMLDMGLTEQARQIALTALDVWKNEVEESYNCFEHFIVATGRGAGWHQFSGLSAPVLSWFGAYFNPGTLSTGYNAWVKEAQFSDGNTAFNAKILFDGQTFNPQSIIVTLSPDNEYTTQCDCDTITVASPWAGAIEITTVAGLREIALNITAKIK